MNKFNFKYYLGLLLTALLCKSCTTVKPYQKQFLNDHYMQTNSLPNEKLENEADSYREGMMGGTDGKAGGGCGCN
ncbi:DUF4266 domain-containing protein [Edaphocola aurantiacus]|uniref:DUF4266 domain-containing protein n=1 Tax=Edaphocola aurantiacus TaxID=2601682 RepID=UPI001C93AF2B|nr:DUF4266 domain-containing protein [Edaphocola aurantiacus]